MGYFRNPKNAFEYTPSSQYLYDVLLVYEVEGTQYPLHANLS
jgi:hypothetical protein